MAQVTRNSAMMPITHAMVTLWLRVSLAPPVGIGVDDEVLVAVGAVGDGAERISWMARWRRGMSSKTDIFGLFWDFWHPGYCGKGRPMGLWWVSSCLPGQEIMSGNAYLWF
jgi:hypothetical protein